MAYTTLTLLRSELGFKSTDTDDDALLTGKLARAQAIIDSLTGLSFEAATATRYYDPTCDVDGLDLELDYPLLTVTTLTNGDSDVLVAAEYVLLPANSTPKFRVRLKSSKGLYWTYLTDPENAISLLGTWGYSATAPADIAEATLLLAGHLYRQRDSQVMETITTPGGSIIQVPAGINKTVWSILKGYRNQR